MTGAINSVYKALHQTGTYNQSYWVINEMRSDNTDGGADNPGLGANMHTCLTHVAFGTQIQSYPSRTDEDRLIGKVPDSVRRDAGFDFRWGRCCSHGGRQPYET